MHERTLGRTEVRLSEVSLGTWGLAEQAYGPVSDEDIRRTARAALDAGVTTFDMAPLWGDGRSERLIGEVTAERRDEITYVTRAGAIREGEAMRHRFDEKSLVGDCHGSLRRLDTDRIDLWMLHNPPPDVWEQEGWRRAIDRLRDEGKIRAWGVSVGDAEQARTGISAGAEAICLVYNLLAGDDLHDLADDVSAAGCGVLVRSPLAYGMLSGKWEDDEDFERNDHRSERWSPKALRQRVRQANMMRFLVHDDVTSLASAAVRYVLANAVVTTALVGARTPEQVREAAAAADGPPYLPDEDLTRVPQVLAASGG